MIRIGIDIGGTFTDFAAWRQGEGVRTSKVPSTPPRFADGVREGLDRLIPAMSIAEGEPVVIVHGTTISTNTVIERSGPPLALLTTAGFRDLLNLQRLRLDKPADLFNRRPEPLVPRELVYAIAERLEPDGSVHTPLNADDVAVAARVAWDAGVRALGVCFLHGYRNPAHERAARGIIGESVPGMDVHLSSDIWPQQAEYERAVLTLLNAYVKKIMGDYLTEIEAYLAERLPAAHLLISKSNGGVMSVAEARDVPVHTLLSGPAAGVTAAVHLGRFLDMPDLLTMDMGGTSTDLSLIWQGKPTVAAQAEVGDFPLILPVTGIEAIGAGGGSIAFLDGGMLRVGPRSAGATPGPACYDQGGTAATLTDAYVLCGYINPDNFLGGRMRLRRDLAAQAMAPIAEALGTDVPSAAEACVTVATSNMVAALLPYLARIGIDPERVTLVLFGGAGAVHGPLLAHEAAIDRVVVPATPSVFCAFGGLASDLAYDVVRSVHGMKLDRAAADRIFGELEADSEAWLTRQVDPRLAPQIVFERAADARYRGQSYHLRLELPAAAFAADGMAGLETAFHREYERLYTNSDETADVDFIDLRVRARGVLPRPEGQVSALPAETGAGATVSRREIRHGGRTIADVPVLDRPRLAAGFGAEGPAIVEQSDATVFVPPEFRVEVGDMGDLILTRKRGS